MGPCSSRGAGSCSASGGGPAAPQGLGSVLPINPGGGEPPTPWAPLRNETPSASGVPGSVPAVPAEPPALPGAGTGLPRHGDATRKVCWFCRDTRPVGQPSRVTTNSCHRVPAPLLAGTPRFQGWPWDFAPGLLQPKHRHQRYQGGRTPSWPVWSHCWGHQLHVMLPTRDTRDGAGDTELGTPP